MTVLADLKWRAPKNTLPPIRPITAALDFAENKQKIKLRLCFSIYAAEGRTFCAGFMRLPS
jgi:hypothetical protein